MNLKWKKVIWCRWTITLIFSPTIRCGGENFERLGRVSRYEPAPCKVSSMTLIRAAKKRSSWIKESMCALPDQTWRRVLSIDSCGTLAVMPLAWAPFRGYCGESHMSLPCCYFGVNRWCRSDNLKPVDIAQTKLLVKLNRSSPNFTWNWLSKIIIQCDRGINDFSKITNHPLFLIIPA